MRIGTTQTHTFELPFDAVTISKVRVLYEQKGKLVLQKTEEDCTLENNILSVRLTQEDTFNFNHSTDVKIQIRVLTTNGEALASDILCVRCDECLSNEVL